MVYYDVEFVKENEKIIGINLITHKEDYADDDEEIFNSELSTIFDEIRREYPYMAFQTQFAKKTFENSEFGQIEYFIPRKLNEYRLIINEFGKEEPIRVNYFFSNLSQVKHFIKNNAEKYDPFIFKNLSKYLNVHNKFKFKKSKNYFFIAKNI